MNEPRNGHQIFSLLHPDFFLNVPIIYNIAKGYFLEIQGVLSFLMVPRVTSVICNGWLTAFNVTVFINGKG